VQAERCPNRGRLASGTSQDGSATTARSADSGDGFLLPEGRLACGSKVKTINHFYEKNLRQPVAQASQ